MDHHGERRERGRGVERRTRPDLPHEPTMAGLMMKPRPTESISTVSNAPLFFRLLVGRGGLDRKFVDAAPDHALDGLKA